MENIMICGVLNRFFYRNEKTGESEFSLLDNGNTYMCKGVIPHYPKLMPLKITGYYQKSEITGKYYFISQDIQIKEDDYDEICAFLCTSYFMKIGISTARNIVKATGTAIFSYFDKHEKEDFPAIAGISTENLNRLAVKMKNFTYFARLLDMVLKSGGSFFNASCMFDQFGFSACDVLNKNPYTLLLSGSDYKVCEMMAKKINMPYCDKKRLHALVHTVLLQNRRNGNTRIVLDEIFRRVHYMEDRIGIYKRTPLLFIAEELCSEDVYYLEKVGEVIYVYLKEDWKLETIIAQNVKRINSSAVALKHDGYSVEDIGKMCGVQYGEEQAHAFNALKTTGIKIFTGDPGTGKTTTLNGLLKKYELENPSKSIVLCAPTGCAARKMTQSTGRKACTIHKLLDIRPYHEQSEVTAVKKLAADCIVIDESSMIDTEIMAILLSSIKNGALVIISGDKNQLPSVGAGDVMRDMIATPEIESYHLHTIYRQNEQSLIVTNSRKVLHGEQNLQTDTNFIIKRFHDEKSMIDEAERIATQYYKKDNFDFKLFTPSKKRKFASGTICMNQRLQKIHNPNPENHIVYGNCVFSLKDHVMFTNNNSDKGYYNGQEGIICNLQNHNGTYYITVQSEENLITLSGKELDDIDLAYASTAHKSQGSECRDAVILIPSQPANMLKRQLLYVEITRAKNSVTILCEGDSLEKAISNLYEVKRETGLREKLQSR